MMRARRKHPVLYWGLIVILLVFFVTDAIAMTVYARTGSMTSVHDAGYRLGQLIAWPLMILLLLAIVALPVWGIVALVRRLRR